MNPNDLDLGAIKGHLSEWARKMKANALCERAFVFGSLINRNGQFFIISGSEKSDVDVLITFPSQAVNAAQRFKVAKEIQAGLSEIELQIAGQLPPETVVGNEGKLSVLLVPEYDVYHSIHKGFDPKIYSSKIFIDLLVNNDIELVKVCDFIDEKYHMEHIEHFAVARMAQKIRNNYLRTSFLGKQIAVVEDDPYDALPKEILRVGALLNFALSGEDDFSREESMRTDLTEGEKFICRCMDEVKTEDELYRNLSDKLDHRQSPRAKSPPLHPDDILLTIELLYDKMLYEIKPSIRETLDRLVAEGRLPTANSKIDQ